MKRKRGFTVIELLIVIVLIAIAVMIFFPIMLRAREAARKATCLSNIKSVALSCLMYLSEYDEVLPACVADDVDGTGHAAAGVYKDW